MLGMTHWISVLLGVFMLNIKNKTHYQMNQKIQYKQTISSSYSSPHSVQFCLLAICGICDSRRGKVMFGLHNSFILADTKVSFASSGGRGRIIPVSPVNKTQRPNRPAKRLTPRILKENRNWQLGFELTVCLMLSDITHVLPENQPYYHTDQKYVRYRRYSSH